MTLDFSGDIWYWRGPAPFYFVTVPEEDSRRIKEVGRLVTYGWGMIPVVARIGGTEWKTALWPKDGRYILPLKDKIRKAEGLEESQVVEVWMEIG